MEPDPVSRIRSNSGLRRLPSVTFRVHQSQWAFRAGIIVVVGDTRNQGLSTTLGVEKGRVWTLSKIEQFGECGAGCCNTVVQNSMCRETPDPEDAVFIISHQGVHQHTGAKAGRGVSG